MAFTCVPRACWTQQSQVCCQKRCPHVWTLSPAPGLGPSRHLAVPMDRLRRFVSSQGKGQVLSLVRVTCSAEFKGYIWLPPSHPDGWEMLKITVTTTRMNPWLLQAARDPRNLTLTENTKMDECRSWVDASNAFFWTSRAVLLSWKHLSFPLPRMATHRSSFWGHPNTDVWAGTDTAERCPGRYATWAAEMERRSLLGKLKQAQWLIKTFEIQCSVRTNTEREDVKWDAQPFQK